MAQQTCGFCGQTVETNPQSGQTAWIVSNLTLIDNRGSQMDADCVHKKPLCTACHGKITEEMMHDAESRAIDSVQAAI